MEAWHVTKLHGLRVGAVLSSTEWVRSPYWDLQWNGTYKNAAKRDWFTGPRAYLNMDAELQPLLDDYQLAATSAEALKEYIFEYVRVTEFPHRPSRFRCVFFWPEEHDPREGARVMKLHSHATSVLKVRLRSATAHRADPLLLNCNTSPPNQMEHAARRYWTGSSGPALAEVLYEGAFEVLAVEPMALSSG